MDFLSLSEVRSQTSDCGRGLATFARSSRDLAYFRPVGCLWISVVRGPFGISVVSVRCKLNSLRQSDMSDSE